MASSINDDSYKCYLCSYSNESIKLLLRHVRFHIHMKNVTFHCPVETCNRPFKLYDSFRNHIYKSHIQKPPPQVPNTKSERIKCNHGSCDKSFPDMRDLCQHLKMHLADKQKIQCPFSRCQRFFQVKSTFTSHLSRMHANFSMLRVEVEPNVDNETNVIPLIEESIDELVPEASLQTDDNDQYVKMLSIFLLKMHVKHHVSQAALQEIVESWRDFSSLEMSNVKERIEEQCSKFSLSSEIKETVLRSLGRGPFDIACNPTSGALRTRHIRDKYIKNNMKYVEPKQIVLGRNVEREQQFCQYVPIKSTLKALFKDSTVREQFQTKRKEKENSLYHDIHDGSAFKQNLCFKDNEWSIQVILYQDAFEVCNPLGAAKRKNKIVGVYYTLGNIFPSCRSQVDPYQLVMLIKEKNLKESTPEHVFGPIISELKELYEVGFDLGYERPIKGSLFAVLGDNLGSHFIGGFTESFTANYFCRYCLIHRKDFLKNNNKAPKRTPANYDESASVATNDGQPHYGIKLDSPFNKIPGYHVCNPGLPPCLGHDLFEGVVKYDLFRMVQYLCCKAKWLSCSELNRAIKDFNYTMYDLLDKPALINFKASGLSGHAIQNWTLLRNFPLIIGQYIEDPNDPVWQQLLLLKSIVSYICAPVICSGQISYLELLIEEYLQVIYTLIPGYSPRPKHHYLYHYPDLIRAFGPLTKSSTLRMESKHQFFKRSIVTAGNYKNVTKTAAEKHQMLQAYCLEGSIFSHSNLFDKAIHYNFTQLSADIRNAMVNFSCMKKNVLMSLEATINHITYKKGNFLVLHQRPGLLCLGEILSIIYSEDKFIFIVTLFDGIFESSLDAYELFSLKKVQCVSVENLLDPTPLPSYPCSNKKYVPLKYALKPCEF